MRPKVKLLHAEPIVGGLRNPDAQHLHCPRCLSWVFSKSKGLEFMVNVRATMFDDTSWFAPFVDIYTSEKLPWVSTGAPHAYPQYPGTDVFVGILNGRVLGSVEVRPATKFYDYEAKYKRTDTKYLVPPELPRAVIDRCEQLALAAYNALGCSGHARPDLRITAAGDPFVLEVNTLPGMTATSLLPKIAKSIGMDYATLCEQILASAR